MMYGWMLHRHRTDLPDMVVLLDDSASMTCRIHYDDAAVAARPWPARLQNVGLDGAERLQPGQAAAAGTGRTTAVRTAGSSTTEVLPGRRFGPAPAAVEDPARGRRPAATAGRRAVVRGLESARETASRLGKGLRDVLDAQRGRPTAAVIMLTDGVTTEGKTIGEVAEYARRKAVPLYLVGLGNDKPPRDLRLSDLLVDEVVFVGDQVNFDFKVTGSGYAGRRATVRLTRARPPRAGAGRGDRHARPGRRAAVGAALATGRRSRATSSTWWKSSRWRAKPTREQPPAAGWSRSATRRCACCWSRSSRATNSAS